jgi:hypothetical protein
MYLLLSFYKLSVNFFSLLIPNIFRSQMFDVLHKQAMFLKSSPRHHNFTKPYTLTYKSCQRAMWHSRCKDDCDLFMSSIFFYLYRIFRNNI